MSELASVDDGLIALEEVCVRYFGLQFDKARRKAALGLLPVPAFRLGGVSRGPLYVRKEDLQAYIDKRYAGASELHRKMQSAV